ncbi:MAG: tyrosine-type recombinase/integrase [Thermoplasmata archaeon]|nr:tyrosine-type recombinase/integrase [Thermoplasmata archaeon]
MTDREFKKYVNTEIMEYERYLEGEKRSENTIKEYAHFVKDMLLHLKKRAEEITAQDLKKYKMYLSTKKKYSKNSLYLAVEAIKAYFKYKNMNVARDLKAPKRPKQMPTYLTEEEVRRLLNAARDNPRDYAILSFLAYSGLRVSELCNLRIEDVDFSERIVRVHGGKGDKDRIVVISPRAIEALEEYISTRNDSLEYLFSSRKSEKITRVQVFRLVKKYARIAGIKKEVTPHVLRHTLATTLLRRGVDIRYIQQFLGHSSVATTQIYTHVNDKMLKSVYDKVLQEY